MEFFRVAPDRLIDHGSGDALRIYLHLQRMQGSKGQCWPAIRTIAAALKMGTRKVQEELRYLEAEGFLEKQQHLGKVGNTYVVKYPEGWNVVPRTTLAADAPENRMWSSGPHSRAECGPADHANVVPRTTEIIASERIRESAPVHTGLTDQIFAAYPLHVARVRGIAAIERAIVRISGRKPPRNTPAWLLEIVQAFAASHLVTTSKHLTHAHNWFDEERYDENPEHWNERPQQRDVKRGSPKKRSAGYDQEKVSVRKFRHKRSPV